MNQPCPSSCTVTNRTSGSSGGPSAPMVVKNVSYSIPPDSSAFQGGTTTVTCR